jgi:two-component system, OmpR family, sensor histidine kinase VicK
MLTWTLKNKGVKIRFITEIIKANIANCKQIMQIAELRHLEGVKGNFAIVDKTHYGGIAKVQENQPLSEWIHSTVKSFIEQQQYFFDMLWNKAIPAEQKIREIEEGIVPIRTRILEKQDEIVKEIRRLNNAANKLSICTGFGGMQMSYNYLFDSYKNLVDKSKKKGGRGGAQEEDSGLRWITNIDRASLNLIKKFLQAGINNIRHIKNMPPLSFGVSDKEVALTIEKMEGGKMSQSFLISNEPLYVDHFNSLFEELWRNSVDATDRIRDIEQGIDLADIEVIPSSAKAQDKYLNIVRSAKEEILWIFPTTNAFIRQEKIGVIELASSQRTKHKS